MKKVLSLMIFPFLLWGTAGVKAQVTIGSDVVPQSGAVLDLSRVNSRDLGLLLPRVWLEDITKWQLRSNPGDSEEERVGMIVYNTNTNVSYGEGLYIWTGKEGGWEPLRRSCVSKPAVPTGIEFSKMGIRLNETITATAIPEVTSGGAIPTTYNWMIPGTYFDITAGSGTREITLKAKVTVTSITDAIRVNAANACGTSADYSNMTTLNILNCSEVPAQPGEISFNPVFAGKGRTSTATITAVSDAFSYTWTIPDGLTPTGTITTKEPTITLTCVTEGTYPAGSIKVKADNACGSSADQNSAVAVTVIDIACPGVVIPGGVHTRQTHESINDDTPYDILLANYGFERDNSKDLCIYYRDGNPGTGSGVSWNDATTGCNGTSATYVDEMYRFLGDWRLPNIAELGYIHELVRTGNGLTDQSGAFPGTTNFKPEDGNGYTYPYWSSTEYTAYGAIVWRFFGRSNTCCFGTGIYDKTYTDNIYYGSYYYSARCVMTME